jgi:hypothetical protein
MLCGVRALLVIAIVLASDIASANKPTLAALAPARDARRAVAIGPAGEVYEPDGKGAWVRTKAGGVAEEVVSASAIGNVVIVGAKRSPPFKLKPSGWSALNVGQKVRATLGSGPRATAIVGTNVFLLDKRVKGMPAKVADMPETVTAVTAVGASAGGIVIATDKGLLRLVKDKLEPFKHKKAPKSVKALVSDRWALIDRGALDLKTMKPFVWPSGVNIVEATTLGTDLVGVSVHGKKVELITIKRGKPAREEVPIDGPKGVVGVVADKAGRIAIALRDGRIALREKKVWTVTEVREEIAVAKPGPEPAESP